MSIEQERKVVDFDSETGAYRATYDYPHQPPSAAVPYALMQITDSEVTDFDPLYETANVDPDALDDMFRQTGSRNYQGCQVTFTYCDFVITVKRYGRIVMQPPAGHSATPPD